jgi:hypothetical protein
MDMAKYIGEATAYDKKLMLERKGEGSMQYVHERQGLMTANENQIVVYQPNDRVDRRMAKTEQDVVELKEKVDFFAQTKEPPLQGIFYQGRYWDAKSLLIKFIRRSSYLRRCKDGRRNHPRSSRLNP